MSNTILQYFGNISRTVLTLSEGLAVTTSYLFRKPVTIQYPDRTPKPLAQMLPKRSRGILELDSDLCTGCTLCMKQCPIDCIDIEIVKDETTKLRSLSKFDINIGKCMFCGICVEACQAQALHHSNEFEGGMKDINRLTLKFINQPKPVAKLKKDEPIEAKPLGSLIRPLLQEPWTSGAGSQIPLITQTHPASPATTNESQSEKQAQTQQDTDK